MKHYLIDALYALGTVTLAIATGVMLAWRG